MNRRNIILTVLIALTVFNVSSLIAVVLRNAGNGELTYPEKSVRSPDGRYAQWFREELQLTDGQFDAFRNANRTYHREGRAIVDELRATRAEILSTLGSETPDSVLLGNLAARVGELHVRLKELTIDYFLRMKAVCNDEQKAKLYELFKAMTDADGNAVIPAAPGDH